jgi:hypothetical protein
MLGLFILFRESIVGRLATHEKAYLGNQNGLWFKMPLADGEGAYRKNQNGYDECFPHRELHLK